MSARRGQRRVGGWTAEQDALFTDHPDWSNAQIAEAASAIGYPRSMGAVSSRRKYLGLDSSATAPSEYVLWNLSREIPDPNSLAWPRMPGADEYRDAMHVRDYLRASLKAERARKTGVSG